MNLHGPVRAPDSAGSGEAKLTLSFDAWKDGHVAASAHTITVKPAPKLKAEPVSEKLIRSLVHPVRTSSISVLKFSADGKRLFAAGYPSGVLQLWDADTWEERRRIETPPGYRGTADYVALPADWSAVYVPMQGRKVVQWEEAGEKRTKIDYAGEVRVWDLATGQSRPPVRLASGRGASDADISADGARLLTQEAIAYDPMGARFVPHALVYRDLAADGPPVELATGFAMSAFAPDGMVFVVAANDQAKGSARVNLFDAQTGKPVALLAEEPGANVYWPVFSPDGKFIAAEVRSTDDTKGGAIRVWDVTSRKHVVEFAAATALTPIFSADSKLLAGRDFKGNADVWDVAAKKAVLTYQASEAGEARGVAVSPDGKRAAMIFWPPIKRNEMSREPDPADLPQPWVELYDLTTGKRTEKMACPHGIPWQMAFSPNGKVLAVGGSGAVHLFDVK